MVLRLGPAAEWFVWPIPALLSPFAGVFYPLATLPRVDARRLAPAAAVVRVRRHARDHRRAEAFRASAAVGRCLAVGYILLAGWFFTRVYRHAVRTGLIARYSAETLG